MRVLQQFCHWLKRPPQTAPTPLPTIPEITLLWDAHNNYRRMAGVRPLGLHKYLTTAAQKHAEWMAANRELSHAGEGCSNFAERARQAGVEILIGGENIAAGRQSVNEIMLDLMASPGHRRNILNEDYHRCGCGIARQGKELYWCVVFASTTLSGGGYVIVNALDRRTS